MVASAVFQEHESGLDLRPCECPACMTTITPLERWRTVCEHQAGRSVGGFALQVAIRVCPNCGERNI
jgi:hypothetical protein